MAEERVKITAYENGPYLVRGPVVITDADGDEYPSEREIVTLYRRSGSTNKPFRDGAASKIGFEAAKRAVQREEEQD